MTPGRLGRMLRRPALDPAGIVPANAAQAHTLERADALLRHPVIRQFEIRGQQIRASFARADARLARARRG